MAASIAVKLIGALFKIPLTSILGGGGMGYFMTAYGFFNPIYALSVAGFPVAVSKLTAQHIAVGKKQEADDILRSALLVFPLVGLALAAAIHFGAGKFVALAGNEAAYRAVLAIAPAIFFACVSSVFRGHFEGGRNMGPTACSQLLEAAVKLSAGIFLAVRCVRSGTAQFEATGTVFGVAVETPQQAAQAIAPYAAAAAICGVTISTAAGSLYLMVRWLFGRRGRAFEPTRERKGYAKQLLWTAFPVCIGALVLNLTSMIDLVSVMHRLENAVQRDLPALLASHPNAALGQMVAEELPNFLYGSYTGLSVTVFNLVPAVTTSLGVSALPMISALWAQKQRAKLRLAMESVLRLTVMAAVPAGMGLCVMARPVLSLLFSRNPDEVEVAAPLLSVLGIAAIFVAIFAPVSSMLQAVGRIYTPVRLMLLGGVCKLTVNFLLVAVPSVNIKAAPMGTLLCYLLMTLGGVWTLAKELGTSVNLAGIFAKPLLASLGCCAVAKGSFRLLQQYWDHPALVLPAVGIGALCYLLLLKMTGAFKKEEFELLIGRSKFAKILANGRQMR